MHAALLKKFHGDPPASDPDLPLIEHWRVIPVPAKVEQARRRQDKCEVLVQWHGLPTTESTWEPLGKFKELYQDLTS